MAIIIQDDEILTDSTDIAVSTDCCCPTSVEYDLCSGLSTARDQIEADGDFWIVGDSAGIRGGNRDFTMGFWYISDINQTGVLMAKDCDSDGREYLLETRAGTFRFEIFDASATTNIGSVTQGTFSTGNFFFVVAGYDKAADLVKISVNGAAYSTGTLSGTPGASTSPLHLGAGCGGSGSSGENINDGGLCGGFFYGGKFLSIAEVGALFKNCGQLFADLSAGQKTSLSAWWNGDETSGSMVDQQGSNSGTAQGSPEDRVGPCAPEIFVDPTAITDPFPDAVKISPRGCYDLVGGSGTAFDIGSVTSEHTDCDDCEA